MTTLTKFDIPVCGTMAWIESAQWWDRETKTDLFHTVTWKWWSASGAFCQKGTWISNIKGNTYKMGVNAMLLCLVCPKGPTAVCCQPPATFTKYPTFLSSVLAVFSLNQLPVAKHDVIFKEMIYLRKRSLCLELIAVYLLIMSSLAHKVSYSRWYMAPFEFQFNHCLDSFTHTAQQM